MFPVLPEDIKTPVRDILNAYTRDTVQARLLGSDGSWKRRTPGEGTSKGEEPFSVQEYLLSLAEKAGENLWASRQEFVVRRGDPGKE
jgi:polyphosphate kinase